MIMHDVLFVYRCAAFKGDEKYDNIIAAFKNVFDDINELINNPTLMIDGVEHEVKFIFCSDYKVCSYGVLAMNNV